MQLKPNNREKQKKLKPLKQPIKTLRPQRQLQNSLKTQQHYNVTNSGLNNLKVDKQNKSKNLMVNSVPIQDSIQHKINTKQVICMQLLQNGHIQSFIDLFYISHKCLPNVMENKNYFGQKVRMPSASELVNTEEEVNFFSQFSQALIKAEILPESQKQQKQVAMNEYNSIAFNYQDQGDYSTAAYFYQRVVELAESSKNRQFQLIALLGLGKCYDQTQRKNQAIQLLEDAFDSSCTIQDKNQRVQMTKLVGRQLIQIYIKKAEQCLKFDINEALQSYQSSLKIAQRSKQIQSQARISHKIGQLYYLEGKYQKSIQFQIQYLHKLHEVIASQINKQMEEGIQKKDQSSLKFKQMQAHASLAKCYLKLKHIQKAQEHLNEYNKMAKQAKAQNYVADSSYYLAKLFQQKNEKQKSIQYYQQYFEAAKSQKQDKKDRKLVDKARVTYAIAKANRNMQKYINIFQSEQQTSEQSLRKILDWKIKRILK